MRICPSLRESRPACSNPCRGSHPCHQNEAGQGPNYFRSLTDRKDCNHPAHKNGRAAIEILAELKIEVGQPVLRSPPKGVSLPAKKIVQPIHRIKQAAM